ncbi:hypothetical protein Q8G35_25810 [Peribacillus simplex]|uniref:Uncharacterized protein n=2 Tax=Peribacillus TaxID=2675229 RepID=A0AA90P6T6_9BACI|nr:MULTISPECIES: hypothetical protein [Peribacillus]MDP1421688.1 hypothetical protein [Peribacillus simplex]MDP1454388.1 hypothetical protein [Peribacillus frigoritolerans]
MTKNNKTSKPSYEKPSFSDPKHEQSSLDKPSFTFNDPASPSKPRPKQ